MISGFLTIIQVIIMKDNIVYIHGSFPSPNFGDFLLFHLTFIILNDELPTGFIIKTSKKNKKYLIYDKCADVSIRDFRNIKVAICTGGGYFGEPARNIRKWQIMFFLRHICPLLWLKIKHVPYVIVGVDAGNISSAILRKFTKIIFDSASIVSVRNKESLDFLRSINVSNNIIVTSDWVMSHYFDLVYVDKKLEEQNLIIHLPISLEQRKTLDCIIDDINVYINSNNLNVIVITDNINQTDTANYIKQKIECNAILYEYNDPFELLNIINTARWIITSKLHVGICGIRLGKNVISIANHPKIKRFYSQIGLSENSINVEKVQPGFVLKILEKGNCTLGKEKIDEILSLGDQNINIVKEFIRSCQKI